MSRRSYKMGCGIGAFCVAVMLVLLMFIIKAGMEAPAWKQVFDSIRIKSTKKQVREEYARRLRPRFVDELSGGEFNVKAQERLKVHGPNRYDYTFLFDEKGRLFLKDRWWNRDAKLYSEREASKSFRD